MSGGVRVVISDRWEDVCKIMRIVHDSYVEVGFAHPAESGMRFIAPYLNEGAVFIYATWEGRPVATAALIPDGAFGLPSDRAYREELDAARGDHGRVGEVSTLAVAADMRRHTRSLYAHIVATGVHLFADTGIDFPVISVEPKGERFYLALFGGAVIGDERPLYGEPAILLGAPREELYEHLRSNSGPLVRQVASLAFDPDPAWREDHRTGDPDWPTDQIAALAAEQGVLNGTLSQFRLLSERHPALLDTAVAIR